MYGYHPAAHAYPQLPYAGTNGLVTRTSGVGPMRGGPWPSSGADAATTPPAPGTFAAWLATPSLGVQNKWWLAGIGALTVSALAYHGYKKRWF